jgi:hypothetical protein
MCLGTGWGGAYEVCKGLLREREGELDDSMVTVAFCREHQCKSKPNIRTIEDIKGE